MSLILNIDTATPYASVCLSSNGKALSFKHNAEQKEHASFVHVAIKQMFTETATKPGDLDAVAVTSGPGSYTGLRVAMSTAKGLCFATGKPLILVNTLEVMAYAATTKTAATGRAIADTCYCPMIDARRMEVFTAVYDPSLHPSLSPCAMVLEPDSFDDFLLRFPIVFFGDGASKFQSIISNDRAIFSFVQHTAEDLAHLSANAYVAKRFADIAYASPTYFKEFYQAVKKP